VCQFYDQVLPLAVSERKEWRFAATSDVLTLRFALCVVKLSRTSPGQGGIQRTLFHVERVGRSSMNPLRDFVAVLLAGRQRAEDEQFESALKNLCCVVVGSHNTLREVSPKALM
jgi:hypothetical protein